MGKYYRLCPVTLGVKLVYCFKTFCHKAAFWMLANYINPSESVYLLLMNTQVLGHFSSNCMFCVRPKVADTTLKIQMHLRCSVT